MDRPTGREAYRAARDMLLRHRDDYDAAIAAFRWLDVGDRFNWALDWFDPVAAGNRRTALRAIGEDGTDHSYSFAEMTERSDRLATWLSANGIADGYITCIGRTDDVFKASDYKISPFELESVLIEHPAVAEAAVVPAPDPVGSAQGVYSLAAGWAPDQATADAIFAHARLNLALYQRIQRIEFMELPKTISGKIRRVDLRVRENSCEPDDVVGEYRDR